MQTYGDDALEAVDVNLKRQRRDVLKGASLCLRPGEVVCLLGANGAGKSSFLSVLAGELQPARPDKGDCAVALNGRPLSALSVAQQARHRAVLPQIPGLAFDLRVDEVVAMGAYPYPELAAHDVDALAGRALRLAGIAELGERRYPQLSGGEQQRVQFARALAQVLAGRQADPGGRYLLLDEPTSSLDPLHQQELLETVAGLAREHGIGVLAVLHDVNLAAMWADRIALLADGALLACGAPSEVLTPGNLRRVYGTRVLVMPHPLKPARPLVVFGYSSSYDE